MSGQSPFLDQETGTVDTSQVIKESIPLAKLIVMFGVLALVPLTLASALGISSEIRAILAVVAQFILAVGAGIILLHIISRAIYVTNQ